jgi:hypothetical protein
MSEDTLKSVCCDSMARQLNWSCDEHSSASDCPDALVGRLKDNRMALLVHDGGTSYIEINYCPWYGASLVPK